MSNEQNDAPEQDEALEPDEASGSIPAYSGLAERKAAEIRAAFEAGLIRDPITATIFGSAVLAKIAGAAAITAATTLGSSQATRALCPRRERAS